MDRFEFASVGLDPRPEPALTGYGAPDPGRPLLLARHGAEGER